MKRQKFIFIIRRTFFCNLDNTDRRTDRRNLLKFQLFYARKGSVGVPYTLKLASSKFFVLF